MTELPSQNVCLNGVANIQKVVADAYHINPKMMRRPNRSRTYSWPRQVAIYLARETLNKPYPLLGKLFGGLHHTTAMHAIKAVEHRMETIPFYREDVESLRAELSTHRRLADKPSAGA